jgi:integrase
VLKLKKRKGSPFWQITGTVVTPSAAQPVRQSTGTTDYAQACEAASALEARIRRELTYGKENETLFAEAAHDYIEDKQNEGDEVCSPRLADLIKEVGTRKLASFSSGEVQDIAKKILPNGTASTRNRHGIAPFMAVYNYAVLRNKAPPMKVERFEEKPAKTVSVDRAWIDAFRAKCADPYVKAMCRLMFETGMRLGTATGLTRAMINASECSIDVPATLLKNDEDHSFPVTESMLHELQNLPDIKTFNKESGKRDGRGRKRNPDLLFGFSYNSGVYRHWDQACTDAKITYVPPHQAGRHSFATVMLVDNEVDPITVAEIAGWKDPNFMLKKYPHARKAKLRAVVERVSGQPVPKRKKRTNLAHKDGVAEGDNVIKLRKRVG